MDQYLVFALVGLGLGSVYAAIGLGVVVTYRGTGIINFATGAMAMWGAYTFDELDKTGDLVLPVAVIPHRFNLASSLPLWACLIIAVASCSLLGIIAHLLIFRPLRRAPVLAKVVASVGLLVVVQSLVVMQFASTPRAVTSMLPEGSVGIGALDVSKDRLWLAAIVAVIGLILWIYFRFTRLGLATSAAAENELAATLARYSPQLLAGSTWVISGTITGLIAILAAPTFTLNPVTYALAIVPALAAALIGRLRSIAVTVIAGLALGSFQAVVTFASVTEEWWPDWAVSGVGDAVPFVLIVVTLFIVGDSLPTRGAFRTAALPEVIRPQNRPFVVIPLVAIGLVALVLTEGSWRFGIITSMIASIIMLSLVVLTGLVGQISLAQAAIAGSAGFALSKLATDVGIPFPIAPILAALFAGLLGIIVGLPALRIRGAQLAVVTLASAVALERFIFRNPKLTDGAGNPIPDAELFGFDMAVREGRTIARLEFGLLALVVLTICALAVGNIARSATGRRFLAVRSNERAGASVGISVPATKLLAFALASFLAGIGGVMIGYSRGQLSANSFTALVGLSFLAFAYLGGITSVSGALVAGTFAPLGIAFVVLDRNFELGSSYALLGGIGLIITAIFSPEGIAGANRRHWGNLMARIRPSPASPDTTATEASPLAATPSDLDHPNDNSSRQRDPGRLLMETDGLTVRYGGVVANNAIDLKVHSGAVVGLIGPNGAGKTSFIDAVTGFTPSEGSVLFDGTVVDNLSPHQRARAGLTRTWQSVEMFGDLTVKENLLVAHDRPSLSSVLLDFIRPTRADGHDDLDKTVRLLGIDELADARPATLSLGQQKLVGVARALAAQPKLVLLDEPAAGLDSGESRVLGTRLRQIANEGIGLLLVDHDMGLVLDVCDYIYVLDFGTIIAEGTPAAVRNDDAVIEAYLGSDGRKAKEKQALATASESAVAP